MCLLLCQDLVKIGFLLLELLSVGIIGVDRVGDSHWCDHCHAMPTKTEMLREELYIPRLLCVYLLNNFQ